MRRDRHYRLGAGAWNREEDVKMGEMSKNAGIHRGAMVGEQAPHTCGAFGCQSQGKVNHARSV